MTKKVRNNYRGWIVLGVCLLLGAGYAIGHSEGYNSGFKDASPTVPSVLGVTLTKDPTLLDDAQQLGIDTAPLTLILTSDLSSSNSDLPSQEDAIGIFMPPNTIKVRSGLSKNNELISLAYEYSHYVWQNFKDDTKNRLSPGLEDLAAHDGQMERDIAPFKAVPTNSQDTIHDEEHSIACTHIDPNELSEDFNNYCNTYIPNRAILFKY